MGKKIEIFVACHKPSEVPKNDIFRPIHVGAKKSKIVMRGMQRDDEGDNISEKNPQYCEMTAQYWAWKHSDAQYIGLCHYRRYLNFSDTIFTNYTPDNRKQVFVPVLTRETEEKYGLLDIEHIRKVVESHDVLVANAQNLRHVNTPYGPQNSVLKHWEAHDMALINVMDLRKMFEIVKFYYPKIYKSMNEYLNGKYFYGFNTFVLKRDLFCEMCEFEFDILSKLEKVVDISKYNRQLSRIYGFMGEILFSSFIYHLRKTRPQIKIKECQMIYFDKTDIVYPLIPIEKDSIKIVFDVITVPGFLLYPALATFIKHIDYSQKYEVIILHTDMNGFYKKYFTTMLEDISNVVVKYLNVSFFMDSISEKYQMVHIYPSDVVAWLLPNYDRCIFLKWNVLIQQNLDALYNINLDGKLMAAARDIYFQGKLNTFYKDDQKYAKSILGIHNIFNVVSNSVVLMDLSSIRDLKLDNLIKQAKMIKFIDGRKANEVELFNELFQEKIKYLGQQWNYLINSNYDIQFFLNEAPLSLAKERELASPNIVIESYDSNAPWGVDNNVTFYLAYWQLIKNSQLEEIFRNYLVFINTGNKMNAKDITWVYLNTLFPKGSYRRNVLKRIFPKKGLVYKTIKKIMNP